MPKIYLNSLPKSGTNLLAKILTLFDIEKSKNQITAGFFLKKKWFPNMQYAFRRTNVDYLVGIDTPLQIHQKELKKIIKMIGDNEFITGHVGYTYEVIDLFKNNNFSIIQIIRDPRAVLNSFVHYMENNKNHHLYKEFSKYDTDDKYRLALDGFFHKNGKNLQSLKVKCNALTPMISDSDILTVKFEDLVGAKGGGDAGTQRKVLLQICDFLNLNINKLPFVIDNIFGDSMTFRKGNIESWKDELPDSLQLEINKKLEEVLYSWGYKK